MTKRQKVQRGAVSVLVVITMLMLIVFGLLALTSALAFERLGRKTVLWAGEYYELDSMATEHVQLIDECLYKAEKAARDYIAEGDYQKIESARLDSGAQEEFARRYATAYGDVDKERMLESAFSRLFFYYSVRELNSLSETNDFFDLKLGYTDASEFLTNWEKEPERGDITLEFLASEGEGPGMKNIHATIAVEPPAVDFAVAAEAVTGGRDPNNLRRFRVLAWQEWQEELTMEDTPFWDGSFETLPDFDLPLDENGELEIDDSLPED